MKMHKTSLSLYVSVGLCLSHILAGGALGRKRTSARIRPREFVIAEETSPKLNSSRSRPRSFRPNHVFDRADRCASGKVHLVAPLRNLVSSMTSFLLLRLTPRLVAPGSWLLAPRSVSLLAPRSVSLLTPNTVCTHVMPQRCSTMTACSSPCATQWPAPSRTTR